ncbi:MAG: hypothetical protein A3G49_06330 [Candidatus Sungbacteria bacterium RIFCSPLOWO2_12_FULL_41_11]|uniref:Uncharacterized protein n=1 Tax=Candidatus Sungbacteria bacterium RIFCSPLOWO2_12_FULL_41_11 TaxID=1802286 RepID=A0A1G2LS64_9BACT|nr:MAG: hypothetical protein A3G49_06330 [Candidatus Sungbacteria bacterium RIFCSPLOWO2_12_FULL_41_11]
MHVARFFTKRGAICRNGELRSFCERMGWYSYACSVFLNTRYASNKISSGGVIKREGARKIILGHYSKQFLIKQILLPSRHYLWYIE